MPSATFYNLPEEKRERLLRAAREEFSRVPYESASVNRIIQSAGIPRGSFYMYFTDKEELFGHLMDSYGALLERRMGELLEQREGDLFAAFLDLFDHIQAHWGDGKYREMADILRCNRQMQPGVLLNREGQTVHKGDVLFRIDASDVENNIEQLQLNVQSAQLALNDLLKTQSDNQKDRNVKADDAGVITELHVDRGDSVTVGTVIADVLDRDHMKLKVPFHSADASGFYVGQAATVTVNGTAETVSGTVESIAATDEVGPGGTLVRQVTILVNNPGVLSETSQGTASVGGAACASGSSFTYASSSQITAKAAGDLDVLNVKEGDRVSKGQVIGVISEADLETQIENARIALENAQLSLKNAQEKLEDYTITSTIDGEVIEKNLDVGDNISGLSNSGASVTYPAIIYDRSELTFDMDVDEKDISKIQVGQKVEITAGALDDQSFTGVVDKININGTTTSGHTSYPVTVKVEGSPEALYPGMNVSAKIIVEEVGSVLALPVEAVERGNTVLVAKEGCLDENGVIKDLSAAEERQVTLGRNDDEYIEIVDGLEEGEVVLALSPQGSSLMSAMGMG